MKLNHIFIVLLALINVSLNSYADIVEVPNEFSSGTPALAAEVNENFTALESAINDNATAIDALAEAKIHTYVINPASINNMGYSNLRLNSSGIYNTTDLTDIVHAPVNLPEGATVLGMDCYVRDNHNTANFSGGNILLMRVKIIEGESPGVYQTLVDIDLETSGNINGLRKLSDQDGLIENDTIDNETYMYYVRFWIQRTEAVSNLMISGCRLQYEI